MNLFKRTNLKRHSGIFGCKCEKRHGGIVGFVEKRFAEVCPNRGVTLNSIQGLSMLIGSINIDRLRVCLVARVKRDLVRMLDAFEPRALLAIRKPAMTERFPSLGEREHISCAKRTEKNFSPLTSHFSREGKRVAFTLAEVLITLGIIGVVAAITLSSVITKIQDRQNIVKWKKEYSVIANAFQSVLNDDIQICASYNQWGGCSGKDGSTFQYSDDFINAMKEKLKIVDYCTISGEKACNYYSTTKWSGTANIYSRYKALGVKEVLYTKSYVPYGIHAYNFGNYAFLLYDGAVVYFGGTHGGPWIVVDVNNFNKGPNEFGRDTFVIKVFATVNTATRQNQNKHIIKPMGAEGTYNKSTNGDICECSKDKGVKTANYIAGGGGTGEVISGACCSAYYLYNK